MWPYSFAFDCEVNRDRNSNSTSAVQVVVGAAIDVEHGFLDFILVDHILQLKHSVNSIDMPLGQDTRTYADDLRIQSRDELLVFDFWLRFCVGNSNGWHLVLVVDEPNEAVAEQEWQLECIVERVHHVFGIDDQLIIRYRLAVALRVHLERIQTNHLTHALRSHLINRNMHRMSYWSDLSQDLFEFGGARISCTELFLCQCRWSRLDRQCGTFARLAFLLGDQLRLIWIFELDDRITHGRRVLERTVQACYEPIQSAPINDSCVVSDNFFLGNQNRIKQMLIVTDDLCWCVNLRCSQHIVHPRISHCRFVELSRSSYHKPISLPVESKEST